MWLYFLASFLNVAYFFVGMGVGYYMHSYVEGAWYNFMGMSTMFFILTTSTTTILAIMSSAFYLEVKFYGKPPLLEVADSTSSLSSD